MYKNEYVSELPINEVKEYFDKLRYKSPWTAEDSKDFEICKERLVVYACKTLEQTNLLDKIRAEIEKERDAWDKWEEADYYYSYDNCLEIIDKYRKEQTDERKV